jgi:hypothetical protein
MATISTSRFMITGNLHYIHCEPGISVGIATDYGLEGPGIESRWGKIFRHSRLALGLTQPPVQWVPSLSRGSSAVDHSPPSNAAVKKG